MLKSWLGAIAAITLTGVTSAGGQEQTSNDTLGSQCDPNYDMTCVPIARDVDCAGGNGNGPAYVQGPVRVVGRDIYGLDRNDDGYGCEPLGWTPPD